PTRGSYRRARLGADVERSATRCGVAGRCDHPRECCAPSCDRHPQAQRRGGDRAASPRAAGTTAGTGMTWDALIHELDAWAKAGKTAEIWWRDDDAIAATPALERLLELRQRHDLGLMLAVIPARAADSLVDRLAREPAVAVAQHGWAHLNH